MAMTFPMGTLYVNGTKVAEVTNLEVVSTRQAAKPPLSKPSRVEKWQRWRNQGAEYVVSEIREGAFDRAYFADGQCCSMYDMRASSYWTFVGYAKPDKVEVGQRWRNQGKDYVVEAVSADVANMGGISRASIQAMLTADTFEYLGMAESADTDEQRRMTDVDVEAGLHTDAAPRVPITKKVDPKAEARRANLEAAKRLIANPPEWAYPKAWMCAVISATERTRWSGRCETTMMVESFSDGKNGFAYRNIRKYHERRIAGMTHERAIDGLDWIIQVNAYARGMERPSPLMGRPGVKGGMSTCDLGVAYE